MADEAPTGRGNGTGALPRRRAAVQVCDTSPGTIAELARAIPATFWYRRTVSEGTKGPMTYEFARKRIMLAQDGEPTTAVWLLSKRTLGAHPRYWYYLSNAPLSAPLRLFVWLSGGRWAIEQCGILCTNPRTGALGRSPAPVSMSVML